MSYNYRVTFERDRGFRLHRDGQSILLAQLAWSKKEITEKQRHAMALISRTHLHAIQQMPDAAPPDWSASEPRTITALEFEPPPADAPLFKYVSAQTCKYMQAGSFQLGSAKYYRTTENQNIRDWQEGLSSVFLRDG